MKQMMKWLFSIIAFGAVLALVTGCATSQPAKQALVCPQCKVVTVDRPPMLHSPDDYQPVREQIEEHSCPGCQGAMTTFFKEGKWQHKCSVCAETPFSCPISHR